MMIIISFQRNDQVHSMTLTCYLLISINLISLLNTHDFDFFMKKEYALNKKKKTNNFLVYNFVPAFSYWIVSLPSLPISIFGSVRLLPTCCAFVGRSI